jgi:tetratricopeptide (TPR) repeat protein
VPSPPREHAWLHGPHRAGRALALAAVGEFDVAVDCDRRRRGPYTAVGSVLRALVPAAWKAEPGLVASHRIEILCAAPELAELLGPAPGTLTSLAPPDGRTRWYSRRRTRRISHGLVDFLRDYAPTRPGGRLALALDGLDAADPTDREFVEVAVRRLAPSVVYLAVGTGETELPARLTAALLDRTRRIAAPALPAGDLAGDPTGGAAGDPAGRADGVAPGVAPGAGPGVAPGAALAVGPGAALAAAFVAADGSSDIPAEQAAYQRLDPASRAGLHDRRAAELTAVGEFSLSLGAVPYHRLRGSDPAGTGFTAGRAALAYCHGMGYYDSALELAEQLSELLERFPDELAEHRYALATWRVQALTMLQRPDEAEPIGYRAQVLAGLGQPAAALADFNRVIELDPHYPEYHFDRGNARRRAGDLAGAIADYEHAMTLTPPFPELTYSRGDARLALGDIDGALADFRYVLDLEPDHLEARVSLGDLLLAAGDAVGAADQVRAGLRHTPENARLLCLLGRAARAGGDAPCALIAFDRALAADPALYPALVCRAGLAVEQGRFDDAVADLDRAAELAGDDPVVLVNRGFAHEAAGRPLVAVADYERAMTLPDADLDDLRAGRDRCLAAAAADPTGEPARLGVH